MGMFEVQVGVGSLDVGELTPVTAVVDTGAAHSMMPESMLIRLGLRPSETFLYSVADGQQVEYGYGMARFELEGREFYCPVIFGDEGQYLLGRTTLQIFNLKADPSKERLVTKPMGQGDVGHVNKPTEGIKKRKLNPVVGWLLVSAKIVVFALRYEGTKDAWINYSTGEVTPVE